MTVFQGYDQTALDRQYNNRARVPEFAEFVTKWTDASAAARAACRGQLDVAYGPGERHRLDIFPADNQPSPALVFIHGGYWQSLDKSVFSFPAPAAVAAGVAFVALGYPLTPEASMDEIVASVRMGLAWLYRHAKDYGIDPNKIHVAGHSAGGHLTAMAMATNWPLVDPALPAALVQTGTAISGLYDLEPIRLCYLNEAIGLDEEDVANNSPIHHIPDTAGTMFLAVGGDESEEFRRQQKDFFDVWQAPARPAVAVELPEQNHFNIIDSLGDAENPLFGAVNCMIWEPETDPALAS